MDRGAVQEHHDRLRSWAKGINGLEAATELLIRGFDGRFTNPSCPWVHPTASGHWIDFHSIPAQINALSGGEQRFLQIAAALDDGNVEVNLGRCLAGMDRKHVHLVLAAVSHAAGTHQHSQLISGPDGIISIDRLGSIYGWEQTSESAPEVPVRGAGISR
ncbi:hypothetical protein ACVBEQ_15500 [Nakamurella sp. GG22]